MSDANEAASWDGSLAADEQIEWQGTPVQGPALGAWPPQDAGGRRRTVQTLTNKRAFIATWHFGVQSLRTSAIATMRTLRLVDTSPGQVYFGHNTVRRKDRSTETWERHIVEVGFLNHADPCRVQDLLLRHGAKGERPT